MQRLIDIVAPEIKFSINEDASEVDGKYILAKISGVFFVPDGKSRNERFYPRELWEKVINSPKVQNLLKRRLMFGTIGHDGDLSEKGIREGNASHIITKIEIDAQGQGICEALILNTPVGVILNNLARAGSQFYVSSRADGSYASYKTEGLATVDPETYDLEGWDFVIEAGFEAADPKLVESLNSLKKIKSDEKLIESKKDGVLKMTEEVMKKIYEENAQLKANNAQLSDELQAVEKEKEKLESDLQDSEKEKQELTQKVEKLAKYEEMGEPEELEKKIEQADSEKEELEQYKELGSPEEVKESLNNAAKTLTSIKEELGTAPQIKKALSEAKAFRKEVLALGGLDKIKEELATLKKLREEQEEQEFKKDVEDVVEETGLEPEEAEAMLKDQDKEAVLEMYRKFNKGSKNESHKKPVTITEGKEKKDKEPAKASSLLENLNKRLAR